MDLLDVDDVVRITGWGRTKVFQLMTSGDLRSFKNGEGRTCKRYVLRRHLTEYIEEKAAQGQLAIRPSRGRIPRASAQRQARQRSSAA